MFDFVFTMQQMSIEADDADHIKNPQFYANIIFDNSTNKIVLMDDMMDFLKLKYPKNTLMVNIGRGAKNLIQSGDTKRFISTSADLQYCFVDSFITLKSATDYVEEHISDKSDFMKGFTNALSWGIDDDVYGMVESLGDSFGSAHEIRDRIIKLDKEGNIVSYKTIDTVAKEQTKEQAYSNIEQARKRFDSYKIMKAQSQSMTK